MMTLALLSAIFGNYDWHIRLQLNYATGLYITWRLVPLRTKNGYGLDPQSGAAGRH